MKTRLVIAGGLIAGALGGAVTYDATTNPGDLIVNVDAEGATLDASKVVAGVTNIVKTGSGDLTSAPLSGYTGNFSINEGCLLVNTQYDLGADNVGIVYINDGGTLRGVQSWGDWGSFVARGKRFIISGAPAEGLDGKITRLVSDCGSSRSWLGKASTFDLRDDATFRVEGQRLKIHDLIVLNGHTLTFDPKNSQSQIQVDCRLDGNGRIVFKGRSSDNATTLPSVTYQNEGGQFGFRSSAPPGTLVVSNAIFEARNLMDSQGGSLELHNAYFRSKRHGLRNDLTSTRWQGPVSIFGQAWLQNYADCTNTMTIAGPIGGSGTLSIGPGWLNLFQSQDSSFSGTVTVRGTNNGKVANEHSGLAVHDASPLFPQATSVTITDGANLLIEGGSSTKMAPLVFSGAANTTFVGGGVDLPSMGRPETPSLVKSGTGALDLKSAVQVTGTAFLSEGTLRLSPRIYGHAGLMEGYYVDMSKGWDVSGQNIWCKNEDKVDSEIPADAWVYSRQGPVKLLDGYPNAISNNIARSTVYMYKGYIWNRNATNETWQFAVHMQYRCLIRVNDAWAPWNAKGESLSATNIFTTTVKPGPNPIYLYSVSGSWNAGQAVSSRFGGMGIAYNDHPTAGVTNVADFVKLEDGGTGRLLTIDEVDDETAAAALLPTFGVLDCAAGTTFDLNGNDFRQGRLVGLPTVANGNLSIDEAWTVAKSDVEDGQTMSVGGRLTFGDGTVISVDGAAPVKGTGAYVLATAASIAGTPTIDPLCASAKNWRVKTTATEVKLVYQPSGTIILFQ